MVARQAVASDPSKAAIEAMQALKNLAVPGAEQLGFRCVGLCGWGFGWGFRFGWGLGLV